MDEKLEKWIDECVAKGTFATKEDAVEFCVGSTRAFAQTLGLTQQKIKNFLDKMPADGAGQSDLVLPLKWSDDMSTPPFDGSMGLDRIFEEFLRASSKE